MNDEYSVKMMKSSHISGGSAAYVDSLYEDYLRNPQSVPQEWANYFKQLPQVNGGGDESHAAIRDYFFERAKAGPVIQAAVPSDLTHERKQVRVTQLVQAFRDHGHLESNLDPLGLMERAKVSDLTLAYHHLDQSDLDVTFAVDSPLFPKPTTLRSIFETLKSTYCGNLGIEFNHIYNQQEYQWILKRLESTRGRLNFTPEQKIELLKQITAAEGLERYLGTQYVGQKRFSLEGGDSLVPMMKELVTRAGYQNVKEIVIGMAHRGRLNVLINVLGKPPKEIFQEFEGKGIQPKDMTGDVKYHLGHSSDIRLNGNTVHLALAFNPSHLEIVAPVVQGSVRSRQSRLKPNEDRTLVLPVILHGDAAFAGQGVVMETFNFSQARGYCTGGTVHIVINNQVGFTTSNPEDARSTLYCTDVAKMVQAPVIHVNGDDPEAVIYAIQMALDYRMQFKRDVVVDLVCYRRHGHNEADEPAVTQPVMYQTIRALPTLRDLYAKKLIEEKVLSAAQADAMVSDYRDALDRGEAVVETVTEEAKNLYPVDWSKFLNKTWDQSVKTGISKTDLKKLGAKLCEIPKGYTLHMGVAKLIEERKEMAEGKIPMNWGFAENLAYASLVTDNTAVRLSGQDCGRGTFAHRHAVLHDAKTGEDYIPLQHMATKQANFTVIDSVLSEEAVLAFEYGFAASDPNSLVIWEAQFGDFANGAQVVVDQFISSGEQKWGRLCGLVMLLPHGYEGQGPEHSSARLERFLQLCAQKNMQVCVPSTPAQTFHMLRRQIVRDYRKPLIVMTPKSLLRHKLAVSTLDELANGEFQLVINEIDELPAKKVRKVVLCSGKVYYELLQKRREKKQTDVAIIRIEQLYPFPVDELNAALKPYAHAKDVVWCQEEPKNQGAWYTSSHNMIRALHQGQELHYVGRPPNAAPASGYAKMHAEHQAKLVNDALE